MFLPQHKRHAQKTTKYVELIIVADNREVMYLPCFHLQMLHLNNKNNPLKTQQPYTQQGEKTG